MTGWPLFFRKFILDFIETGLAALLAITFVVPTSVTEGKQVLLAVGAAVLGALVSAIRRATPDFIGWLKDKLGVGE